MPFKDGRPEGYYENFVTGFWVSGKKPGRGVGPAGGARGDAQGGALLIADDTGGTIWHVSYTGAPRQSGQPPAATTGAPR